MDLLEKLPTGNSLAVQWLGLCAFTAEGWVRFLVWELRSHKLHSTAKNKKQKKKLTNIIRNNTLRS